MGFTEGAKAALTAREHRDQAKLERDTVARHEEAFRAIRDKCIEFGLTYPAYVRDVTVRGPSRRSPHSAYEFETPVEGFDNVDVRVVSGVGSDVKTYIVSSQDLMPGYPDTPGRRYAEFNSLEGAGRLLRAIERKQEEKEKNT